MKYIDREGNISDGTTGQDKLLSFLYGHMVTRMLMRPVVSPVISKIGGRFLETRVSSAFVKPFVRSHKIDLGKYEKQTFDSYNDFFTRKIKPEEREISADKNCLISPCDGKISVYPIREDGEFLIKHTRYSVESLLRDRKLAKHYIGGWAMVIRLTVDDYHRYCYVADGMKSAQRKIKGVFHTVNPVANDVYPIYKQNSREYCLVKTELMGAVLQMEVGALLVGKIANYKQGKVSVTRGEEKGRFEFGGSTVVLMIEPGKIVPDSDLLRNTSYGLETYIRMGEQIGVLKEV